MCTAVVIIYIFYLYKNGDAECVKINVSDIEDNRDKLLLSRNLLLCRHNFFFHIRFALKYK